jgi:Zn-dependent M16 (insulinase) family peptidase
MGKTMTVEAFKLVREQQIKELDSQAFLYVHRQTGTEVLLLKNRDENKVFGIIFRTPPRDATGLPHILEHSVLCGSRKYPVKEPFVELLKGSLQTFLNAFTYPDKTCYPVASPHPKDFHNLVDVYLDAVFYPLITPEVFRQEGWHYHQESPDDPVEIRGVVYNEMKGAYSSPERILMETVQQSLFPDHPYAFDSGGDPRFIPRLSYEQFVDFHRTFYHPSNSKVFFYGNGSIEDELSHLAEYLKDFSYLPVDSAIPPVKPLTGNTSGGPILVEKPYAVLPGSGDERFFATLNVLLTETRDVKKNFAFQMLYYILLGMPGSPLRKALIDSGLGEDITGVGLETELRNLYFSTGLRGIKKREHVEEMVSVIEDTLRKLVRDGIPRSTIEAAVNTIEFRYRECHTGGYPRGLVLMLTALTTWLYDGDPLALLAFESPLECVKSDIDKHRHYFEELIDEHFLQNSHKSLVVLYPDEKLIERFAMEERAFIESSVGASLKSASPEERLKILEETISLKKYQERVDSPEDLSKIPRLKREDLSKEPPIVDRELVNLEDGGKLIAYPLSTHGIVYLDLGFRFDHLVGATLCGCPPQGGHTGLHQGRHTGLPLLLLPLFCSALLEMGTKKRDYVELSERISSLTGGIRPKILIRRRFDDNSSGVFYLFLRGKALTKKFPELLDILREIITEAIFDSKDRFFQILLKHKAIREQRLVPEGHRMVLRRIRAHFGLPEEVKELLSGISQYMLLKEWSNGFDESRWDSFSNALYMVRDALFRKPYMVANLVCDENELPTVITQFKEFVESIPSGEERFKQTVSWNLPEFSDYECFAVPAQVHYVGKGGTVDFSGSFSPGWFLVVLHHLRTTWLWDKVRVQGGAYGAHCFFDRASRILVMTSYRDPHLVETERVFDDTVEFLKTTSFNDEDITKSVIGTYGKLDPPMFPDDLAYTSTVRFLTGETDEMRKVLREEILEAGLEHFKEAAQVIERWRESALTKVLGPSDSLERVAQSEWRARNVKIIQC